MQYGEWETGEWMEAGFWDKYLAERQKRIEEEEKEREKKNRQS